MTEATTGRESSWRWWVCGLLLLATMLNYMDRQALSQSATDITKELSLSNEDYGSLERGFGLAFAAGGIVIGLLADRVNLRWLYPAVLLAWSAAGVATGWARGYNDLLLCRIALGFFEAGQWPCALTASQRLLSRQDRALGNSLLQSGASLGAILTPIVVQFMVSDAPGSWPGPFLVIGLMGIGWTIAWLFLIKGNDLAIPADNGKVQALPSLSRTDFVRRFLVLVAVVVSINLCWHFFRAWLPKMLRETHDYSRGATNLFTSAFYIATDVGCIASGLAIKRLATRKFSVHTSRVIVFSACALLTSLSVQVAMLNASPLMLGLLLIIGAGALGLFPIYYSLTQELSVKNQGLVIGLLAAIAWIVSSLMHTRIGHWIDSTKSYSTILVIAGLAPLAAAIVLIGFWGKTKEEKAIPETR